MRVSPLVLCCWPGLPRLWLHGDFPALAIAVFFGGALNLLLLISFRDLAIVPPALRMPGWWLVGGVWLFSAVRSYREFPRLSHRIAADDRGLFIQAQGEYLRGHWFEAESLLKKLLSRTSHDADAHLLLASLYRHTRRYDEARARLELLARLDGADKWRWEVESERRLLRRAAELAVSQSLAQSES